MSNVIQFPKSGEKIALYTNDHVYIGTAEKSETLIDRAGIWLTNAAVMPISSRVDPADILRLASVLVMWDKIVAASYAPEIDQPE